MTADEEDRLSEAASEHLRPILLVALNTGMRFHDLRHTFAGRLVEQGVDLIRVKEILGHSTVKITERYTHSSREERKKAVELLCKEPSKTAKKRENLLHSRGMERGKEKPDPVSYPFSMN